MDKYRQITLIKHWDSIGHIFRKIDKRLSKFHLVTFKWNSGPILVDLDPLWSPWMILIQHSMSFKKLYSYIHTNIHTYKHTYIQTDMNNFVILLIHHFRTFRSPHFLSWTTRQNLPLSSKLLEVISPINWPDLQNPCKMQATLASTFENIKKSLYSRQAYFKIVLLLAGTFSDSWGL